MLSHSLYLLISVVSLFRLVIFCQHLSVPFVFANDSSPTNGTSSDLSAPLSTIETQQMALDMSNTTQSSPNGTVLSVPQRNDEIQLVRGANGTLPTVKNDPPIANNDSAIAVGLNLVEEVANNSMAGTGNATTNTQGDSAAAPPFSVPSPQVQLQQKGTVGPQVPSNNFGNAPLVFEAQNIRFPTAFDCLPGEPKEHEGCNNCSIDVTCKIPPFPVENLPDARLFRMEMWEISDANDNKNDHCVWVAYVDKAYILMKKSETDSDILDGRCWAKSRKIWLIVLMLVFCLLLIAGAVAFIVFMLVIRRRKRSKRITPAEPKPFEGAFAPVEASTPSKITVEQGVVVPDSLRSEGSVVDDAKK